MTEGDKWLWDRSGPPDAQLAALEALLAPLAHDRRPFTPAAVPASVLVRLPLRRRPAWNPLLAAAAAVLMTATIGFTLTPLPRGPVLASAAGAAQLSVIGHPDALPPGTWFEATAGKRELALGAVGHLTLAAGSRMQVHRLLRDEARIYLERGQLEAKVSGDARPRFFQVATPSTVCVDLGCRYTLDVTGAGDTVVRVLTGRVAFENDGREVYVPARATCRARRGRGPGTPHFEDAAPGLRAALEAFDAAVRAPAGRRRALARALLAEVHRPKDALPAWHLLQDDDPAIVTVARAALEKLGGRPEGLGPSGDRPGPTERTLWRRHLAKAWRLQLP